VSKAFTKEDEGTPPVPVRKRGAPVPDPNFVTPQGLRDAKAELDELAKSGGDPDRMRELTEHLATAQAIEPEDRSAVGLGAAVTVEDDDGKRTTYRVVGAIEADTRKSWVSWQTPIANALWGLRVGDTADLPKGEVTIVAIDYVT
jgi:transcription elongation GreA/GreB family factor